MTARFISFPLRRFNSLGATTNSRGMVASRSKPTTSKNTMNMNKPHTPQSRPSNEKLDYMLLNLPNGMAEDNLTEVSEARIPGRDSGERNSGQPVAPKRVKSTHLA